MIWTLTRSPKEPAKENAKEKAKARVAWAILIPRNPQEKELRVHVNFAERSMPVNVGIKISQ